jgi:UDPglucose--hexose-1-phosphate uridylyltransferase
MIRQEIAAGDRVVRLTDHFLALSPYAACSPYETWILPRQHNCLYEGSLSGELVADLAGLLSGLFRTLGAKLGDPPFEMTLYTAPNLAAKILPGEWSTIADDYHWHIEIRTVPDRLNGIGGIHVNETPPEEAAKQFREAWL